ncbi:MAG: RNA 2',3'-cyclic phosphodiesterase [Candidatus Bathyarchaeota archaeon]|nr:MAG: RNA 2',3'-cyclic phosphodiesterase [Candidatus Bathyarchaeota archaeon]
MVKSIYWKSLYGVYEGMVMPEAIRSFIAFDIEDESILKRIGDVQNLLLKTGADLKIVEPKNIHITIRFLGNITSSMVEKIGVELKRVQFTPFDVKINGIGAFPDLHYPRVLWAGITEGATQLKEIFSQIEPRLRSLGFTPDPKGFSPHLTIARVKSGKNKSELVKCVSQNVNYEFGIVRAACLRLKRSDLTPKGPVYSTLKEHCPQR